MTLDRWNPSEDDKLKELFPHATDQELVKTFEKTISAIKARAYRLGIKRDRFMLQRLMKERSRLHWQKVKAAEEETMGKPSLIKLHI